MLKDMLINDGAIKFGDFTLTSGRKSKYYVNLKAVTTNPEHLSEIADELSKKVHSKIIAGVELGAVPLLVAVSLKKNIPYIIIRKQENDHGIKDPVIGNVTNGMEIEIIEDTVTTGNSVIKAAELLRSRGAKISRAICVVDREEGATENLKKNGIELDSVIKISQVMNVPR